MNGSNDKKKKLHHILAKAAQDNSDSHLSPPVLSLYIPMNACLWAVPRAEEKLVHYLLNSRHRGYHSSLENQDWKERKGEGTYFGRNEHLKHIIFILLASSLPPLQLVKLPMPPFLFRQMLGSLFLPAHTIPVTLSLRLLTHLLKLKEELVGQLLAQSSLWLLLDLYAAVCVGWGSYSKWTEGAKPHESGVWQRPAASSWRGSECRGQQLQHREFVTDEDDLVLEKGRCPS